MESKTTVKCDKKLHIILDEKLTELCNSFGGCTISLEEYKEPPEGCVHIATIEHSKSADNFFTLSWTMEACDMKISKLIRDTNYPCNLSTLDYEEGFTSSIPIIMALLECVRTTLKPKNIYSKFQKVYFELPTK
jgi:hypothetical protein